MDLKRIILDENFDVNVFIYDVSLSSLCTILLICLILINHSLSRLL